MEEMMKFREELQELVYMGQELLQKMNGGSFGERRRYGRRDNNGGGNNGGSGMFGQRGPWMNGHQQGNFDPNWQNGQGMGNINEMDPRWFM